MRPRRATPDQVSEMARRRLELLTAELALLREEPEPAHHELALLREEPEPAHHEPALLREEPEPAHHGPAQLPGDGPDGWRGGRLGEPARPASETAPAPPGRHARRPVGSAARLAGWVHDRLPATLQGRVGLSSGNLTVVALLVAAGFALTAWWVVRADSPGEVVAPSTWVEGLEASPSAGASADPAAVLGEGPGEAPGATQVGVEGAAAGGDAGVVVVDVTGKVRRRGIVTLPLGSRVVDAIDAAGGPRRGVDLAPLNLARVLVDGEQIVVGVPPPAGVAAAAASASGGGDSPLVNINVATQTELEELPGVGPVTAEAIISWRTENGAFTSVDELLEVSGIGDAILTR